MKERTILKSLHVCLGVNIKAYDSNLNEIQKYTSKKIISPQYNELDLIKSVKDEKEKHNYYILTGAMNEVFLLHNFEDRHYLFGPFNVCFLPPDDFFTHFLKQQNISVKFKKVVNNYSPEIKFYSFEDIKDIIKLVHLLQSKDRIHRLGLKDNQYTQYYYLQQFYQMKNGLYSLDERVYNRLTEKEELMLNAIDNHELEILPTEDEDLEFFFNNVF